MDKKRIISFLLFTGLLPFIIPLIKSCYHAIAGVDFFFSHSSGFEAFFLSMYVWSAVFWPTYVIGILIILISIIMLRGEKRNEK